MMLIVGELSTSSKIYFIVFTLKLRHSYRVRRRFTMVLSASRPTNDGSLGHSHVRYITVHQHLRHCRHRFPNLVRQPSNVYLSPRRHCHWFPVFDMRHQRILTLV